MVATPPPLVNSLRINRSPTVFGGAKPNPGLGAVPFWKTQNPICADPLLEVRSPKKYSTSSIMVAPALTRLTLSPTGLRDQTMLLVLWKSFVPSVNWLSLLCGKSFSKVAIGWFINTAGQSEGFPSTVMVCENAVSCRKKAKTKMIARRSKPDFV